jgi:hypothetical protein
MANSNYKLQELSANREDFIEFTNPSGRGTIGVAPHLISEQEIVWYEQTCHHWVELPCQ